MIIVSNPRADQPVAVPAHDDGTPYRFEMVFNGGSRRAYADTWTELVEALVGDYANVQSSEEADELRLMFAIRTQVELQAEICAGAVGHKITDQEARVLLGDRHTQPRVGMWRSEVPLVLVTSYYQPAGQIDRPIGRPPGGAPDSNLIWIDPSDEQTLITSIDAAGVASVAEVADLGV